MLYCCSGNNNTESVMGTINKKSVRDEFNRLEAEFSQLRSDGKVSKECHILFKSLFLLMNLILTIFLEKSTKKNSKNSSKPSSQSDEDKSFPGNKGTTGKGKSEKKNTADNSKTTETVTLSKVHQCNVCGEDLSNTTSHHCERRTKIDIVFEKVVEHVDAEIKHCPNCDSTVKGSFPEDMQGPLQYGNGIKAYIINLLVCQMISLNRVQKLVKAMIGTIIAESTMLKFILRLYQALENWESLAMEQLLKSPAINVDETSLRVDKKRQWIHVYSSGNITCKLLHKKRGKEAIDEFNIIPRYGGVIIHDCWGSYLTYNNCDHGLCGSHLLRELTFVVESNGYAWASNMKALLQETCRTVSKGKRKKLTEKKYANLQKRYRNIITRGEKELPIIPPKSNGKRGKIAKSDAHNLWERLKEHESSVLLFARNKHVSFTNNRAERDLRMSKVKQKVSGCFRMEIYAKAYCRISSYLQTMANKGVNPLIAIQMALTGKFDWMED